MCEAQLTMVDSAPELLWGNLVLPVASCFSQNTKKQLNAQFIFYSDQSKKRKKEKKKKDTTPRKETGE